MTNHYDADDLSKFGDVGKDAPELFEKFEAWYSASLAPGTLTGREKALIGLAVAHVVQCPYCIESFSKKCLETGSDTEQMTEAVHVASAVRGGAALVHGVQMRKWTDKLTM